MDAAVEEFLSEAVIITDTELGSSYIIGEYDWVVVDNEGEDDISIHIVPASNATNLESSLTELLERVGEIVQNRADELASEYDEIMQGEEDISGTQQDNNATAARIRRFGSELQANASKISAALVKSYDKSAAANDTHIYKRLTDRVNSALDNIQIPNPAGARAGLQKFMEDIISIGNDVTQLESENGSDVPIEVKNDTENLDVKNTNGTGETTVTNSIDAANTSV